MIVLMLAERPALHETGNRLKLVSAHEEKGAYPLYTAQFSLTVFLNERAQARSTASQADSVPFKRPTQVLVLAENS